MHKKIYSIFLASSSELAEDRKEFELFVNRQNKLLNKKNIFLDLVIREESGDTVSLTQKQDDYNKELKTCDIFVVMYWTKVGTCTNIGFDMAWAQFRYTGKHPRIFVFEKTAAPLKPVSNKDKNSFKAFQKKLNDTRHFINLYDDHHKLTKEFKKNLSLLFDDEYLKFGNNYPNNEITEYLYTDGNSAPGNFICREDEHHMITSEVLKGKDDLADPYSGLGKVYSQLGLFEKALDFCKNDFELSKQLYENYPENAGFKDGLALSYQNLGKAYNDLGDLEKALNSYQEYNKIEKQLSGQYPLDSRFKDNLSISYQFLGNIHVSLGNLEKAFLFYKKYIEIKKQLYKEDPENISFIKGLAISYQFLGEVHITLNDADKALKFFIKFNKLTKELYDTYSSNIDFKYGFAISNKKLGDIYIKKNKLTIAKKHYFQSLYLYEQLIEASPKMIDYSNNLNILKQKLKEI
ncbi:MAG: Tetratricopeptide 2 repeat protein [Mucilaginibacter sp.]|nr:Tetratricopeptide 2 repeat protein [Mucilaginibacter sp.]